MNMHNKNRKKPNENILRARVIEPMTDHSSLNDKYVKLTEGYGKSYGLEEVKKYLSYIKNSVHPTLSREAANIIKSFYIILRDNSPSSFQITTRQLESLVRLAMARARIECREEVTE